jgi:hypothetical protein
MAEAPVEQPHAAGPPGYAELDLRGRLVRLLGALALTYHLAAVLVAGAAGRPRELLGPYFHFYGSGLRMTDSWGMFGKPPVTTNVVVEGEERPGVFVPLVSSRADDRSTLERLRDVRIRKIQTKLTDAGDRKRWGDAYLDYFCAHHAPLALRPRRVRAVEIVHELRDERGAVTRPASTRIVQVRSCPR